VTAVTFADSHKILALGRPAVNEYVPTAGPAPFGRRTHT